MSDNRSIAINYARNRSIAQAIIMAEENGFATFEFGVELAAISGQVHSDNPSVKKHVLAVIDANLPQKYFLTGNGNLLVCVPSGRAAFITPKGGFLRYATDTNEIEHLKSVCIEVTGNLPRLDVKFWRAVLD